MDEMFDLDFALTVAEEDSAVEWNKYNLEAQFRMAAARLAVEEMATTTAAGGRECAVCIEGFGSCGAKQVRCGHVFHESCIFEWLSINNSCPLCRCNVSDAT